MQMEGISLLTTGDITGEYEMYAAAKADVLKVPHHGSAYSTNNDFLNAVDPQIAIISCSGLGAQPSKKTVDRLTGKKITLIRTDRSGAVTLLVEGGQFKVQPFLKE
jgi:competence protein ComEC